MTFQEHAQDFFALQELVNEAFFNEDGTAKEVTEETKASIASIVDQWGKDFSGKAERVAQFIIELENQVAALQSRVAELQSALDGAAAAMRQREAAVHASYRRDLVPYQEVQQTSALVVWRPRRQQQTD